jgi:hypothetical protein
MGKLRLGLAPVVLVSAASAFLAVAVGSTTAGASVLDGVATTASPGTSGYLDAGGSQTEFTVSLPAQAACSGNSRSDGYRVFSYLVEPSVNVSTITFHGGLPDTSANQYGLVEADGTYWGDKNTAPSTGEIIQIPNDFEWGPLVSDDGVALDTLLYQDGNTSGVWDAGIACTNNAGTVTDFWNTQVTFTASGSSSNPFAWSAVPGQHVSLTSGQPDIVLPGPASSSPPPTAAPSTTPPTPTPTTVPRLSPHSSKRTAPAAFIVPNSAPGSSDVGIYALFGIGACAIVALLLLGFTLRKLRRPDR